METTSNDPRVAIPMTQSDTVSFFPRFHIVMPGDSLASIAKQYYDDASLASALAHVNGMAETALLTAGTRVKVPNRKQLHQPLQPRAPQLGDVAQPPIDPATGLTDVTVTAVKPFYLNPLFWAGLAAGGALTYFLIEYGPKLFKKSRK